MKNDTEMMDNLYETDISERLENCILKDKKGILEETQLLVNNMSIGDVPSNFSKQDSSSVEQLIRKFEHQRHFKHAVRKETLSVLLLFIL